MKHCNEACNCTIFHQETLNQVKKDLISDEKINKAVQFLKVIADPTRMKILEAIKDYELCVCDLGHLLNLTKSAISHQMKTLKKYELVKFRKEGKMVYYKLKDEYVTSLIKIINEYTEDSNA